MSIKILVVLGERSQPRYSARAFDPPVSRNVNGLACRSASNSHAEQHDSLIWPRPYRISFEILPAILSAASWMESRARWAYRAVVSMSLCPSSLPITGRVSPSANPLYSARV